MLFDAPHEAHRTFPGIVRAVKLDPRARLRLRGLVAGRAPSVIATQATFGLRSGFQMRRALRGLRGGGPVAFFVVSTLAEAEARLQFALNAPLHLAEVVARAVLSGLCGGYRMRRPVLRQ